MLSLTLRLPARRVHLVRQAAECDWCSNRAAHVRVAPERFTSAEITRAVQTSALSLADLREIAGKYGLLHHLHRVHDALLLDHIAWLLDTERLLAFDCVQVFAAYGPATARPTRASSPMPRRPPPVPDVKTWVEIELRDDSGKPLGGQSYRVKVPGGVVEEGRLDGNGRAKISNIDPGMCEITFPDIDAKEWKRA